MVLLRHLYGRLHLTVNAAKSAIASVFGRKFLGYAFWVAPGGAVRRRLADKAVTAFKDRIRNTVLTIKWADQSLIAQTRQTSISRTARCGPACQVVWQGCDQR